MQAFLLSLLFQAARLIFGWLFKILRPVLQSVLNFIWPTVRLLLIVTGLVAALLVLGQLLMRRSRRLRAA